MVVREPLNYTSPSKRELPKGEKHVYKRFVQSWKRGSSQGETSEKKVKKTPIKKALPKQKEAPEIKYVPSQLWKPSVEKIVLDFTRDDLIKDNFLLGSRFILYSQAIYQRHDSNGFLMHFKELSHDANISGNMSLKRATNFLVDMMEQSGVRTGQNGTIEAITSLITFIKTTLDFKQYLQDDIWRFGRDNDLDNIMKILGQEMSENEELYIKEALYNGFLTLESYEIEELLENISDADYKDYGSVTMIQEALRKVVTTQMEEEEKLLEEREQKEKKFELKSRKEIEEALEKLYEIPLKKNFEKIESMAERFNEEFFLSVLEASLSNTESFSMSKFKAAIKKYNLLNLAEVFEMQDFDEDSTKSSIIDLSKASEAELLNAGISRGRSNGGSIKSIKSEFSDSAIGSEAPGSPKAFNETGIFDSAMDILGNSPDFHQPIE